MELPAQAIDPIAIRVAPSISLLLLTIMMKKYLYRKRLLLLLVSGPTGTGGQDIAELDCLENLDINHSHEGKEGLLDLGHE